MNTTIPMRIETETLNRLKQLTSRTTSLSHIMEKKLKQIIAQGRIHDREAEKMSTSFSISPKTAHELTTLSEQLDMPVARIIRAAVRDLLAEHDAASTADPTDAVTRGNQ